MALFLRHHYHCEACAATWFVETETVEVVDCPYCRTRDIFSYRSDTPGALADDAAKIAKRLAAKTRAATVKPAPRPARKLKRAS